MFPCKLALVTWLCPSNHIKSDIFYDPLGKILIKQVRNLNLTENLFGDFWAAFNPFPCKMSLSNICGNDIF